MRKCDTARSPDPRKSSSSQCTSSKASRIVSHQARTPSWPRKVVPSASATIDVNSTSSVVSATKASMSPALIASKAAFAIP